MTQEEKNSCELVSQELVGTGLLSLEKFNALCEKHGVDPKLVKLYNMAIASTK